MSKQNVLRITLFVSVLAFNPAIAQIGQRTDTETRLTESQKKQTITDDIAMCLEAKGLEADAAERISRLFVSENGAKMEKMVTNITENTHLTKEAILSYLGNEALFGKSVSLDRYDTLVSMANRINGATPDPQIRTQLKITAEKNSELIG